MPLTPEDIVNYPLRQAVRGYAVKQVDELLDQVADEIERLRAEVADVRRRSERAEQRLDEVTETEATLKRTLVTAQRAAEQSMDEAKQRAAELLDDARREAASILGQARLDVEELRTEVLQAARAEEAELRRRRQLLEERIDALRVFERDYRSRLRAFAEAQLRTLDEVTVRPSVPEPEREIEGLETRFVEAAADEPLADEHSSALLPAAIADDEPQLGETGERAERRTEEERAALDEDESAGLHEPGESAVPEVAVAEFGSATEAEPVHASPEADAPPADAEEETSEWPDEPHLAAADEEEEEDPADAAAARGRFAIPKGEDAWAGAAESGERLFGGASADERNGGDEPGDQDDRDAG